MRRRSRRCSAPVRATLFWPTTRLRLSARRVARTLVAAQREPVYRYFFTHALENDPALKANGAVHTVEHPFFFPFTGKYVPSEAERKLQDAMALYWSRMAR